MILTNVNKNTLRRLNSIISKGMNKERHVSNLSNIELKYNLHSND